MARRSYCTRWRAGEFIRVHGIPHCGGTRHQIHHAVAASGASIVVEPRLSSSGRTLPIFIEEGDDYDDNGLDHETYDYDHVIDFLDTKYPNTTPGTTADQFHSYTTAHGSQDDWRTDTTGVEYFHFYGVQFGNNTIEKTVAKVR